MKTLIVLSIVLAQSAFLFGQKGSDGAIELIREGVELHDQHDYVGAIVKYDEALVMDPFNLTALSEKAMTLYYLQKYEEAVENCKLVIEKHPGDDLLKMVYPTYANALDSDGKPEDAIDVYNEGIKLFPDYGQLHYNKGVTHVGQKEYDDALASFETSARLDPNHGSSHNGVGRLQYMNNNKMPTLLALFRFSVVEPEGPRAEANFPIIEKIMYGNATKTGKNTITINVDDFNLPDEEDGEEPVIQANDFSSTELLLSFAGLLSMESKNPVEGFRNQMESICSSLKESQEENFGYYWEYYVPYFLEMKAENHIETFSYIVYSRRVLKKYKNGSKRTLLKLVPSTNGHRNMNGLAKSNMLAKTPTPPYYAVIFSALQSKTIDGYSEMAQKMVELASKQDGFIGVDSAEGDMEITVSYWKDEASILDWKSNIEHKLAQEKGKQDWYDAFEIRISKVERAYSFEK